MKNVNWDEVQDDIPRAKPGGYIAKIMAVEDDEQKECLKICWEFYEGELKGTNQATYDSFGFWPMLMVCSYKPKALRFFKGFKTAVEMSNNNFVFRNDPQTLVGKVVGVVLGEEEYLAKDGSVKTRLYVAEKRSGQAIRQGDYKIPALKKLKNTGSGTGSYAAPASDFVQLDDDDEDLPF